MEQARVSEPVSLMSARARKQQLWNAASNDEISTVSVGRHHAYGVRASDRYISLLATGMARMHRENTYESHTYMYQISCMKYTCGCT